MSYLPRMSKTYKEPQEIHEEPEEDFSPGSLKPASALLNEKTFNPQMALKHYRFIPHAPPVLPGPSVLEEALQNELLDEAYRLRKSSSKVETLSKNSENLLETPSTVPVEVIQEENEQKEESTEKVKRIHSKKSVKGSKTGVGKKRISKTVKKDSSSGVIVNMQLTDRRKPFTAVIETKPQITNEDLGFLTKEEKEFLKRENTSLAICDGVPPVRSEKPTPRPPPPVQTKEIPKQKLYKTQSVQCTILESPSKVIAIPPVVYSLLRTLGFLFQEIKKEEAVYGSTGGKKFPVTQAQLILGELCNHKVSRDSGFDITYSDFKRLEKISGELQKYIVDIYGDKEEYIDKMEDLKRVFIESRSKELELVSLKEKLVEYQGKQGEEIEVKEEDLKYPEITLQNKRLESEQLFAEVEFSNRELKKFQNAIAELEWDIRTYQEQVTNLKKSVSKSKTEVVGRKNSIHRFSSETLSKGSRNSESGRKKT